MLLHSIPTNNSADATGKLKGGAMRILLLVALILAGCSTLQPNQTRITFDSNPPGATISNGSISGTAPLVLIWTLNNGQATALSEPITATWVSGAITTNRMNLKAGQEGAYTIVRPQGVAGLDSDIQWAIHLKQRQAAQPGLLNAIGQGLRVVAAGNEDVYRAQQGLPPRPRINCTSRAVGNTVQTDCQ